MDLSTRLVEIALAMVVGCILLIAVGCDRHTGRNSTPAEQARMQTLALASISAKFPELKPSDLQFEGMTNTTVNGCSVIQICYLRPASSETKQENTAQGSTITTSLKGYRVTMSSLGEVQNISKVEKRSMTKTKKQ